MHGRIKGTVLLSSVKALRAQRTQAALLLSERVGRFLNDERVLPASWYPEEEAFEIFRAFLQLNMPPAGIKAWTEMGRRAALQHAHDEYRHIIRGDARQILSQVSILFKSQHDTGDVVVHSEQPGEVEMAVRGFGALCPEWSHMLVGYFVGLLQATGNKNVVVRILERDFLKGNISIQVTWTEPS